MIRRMAGATERHLYGVGEHMVVKKTSRRAVLTIFRDAVCVTSSPEIPPRRLSAFMGLSGVEPLTSRLSGVRSNHLSYRPGNGLTICTALFVSFFLVYPDRDPPPPRPNLAG